MRMDDALFLGDDKVNKLKSNFMHKWECCGNVKSSCACTYGRIAVFIWI